MIFRRNRRSDRPDGPAPDDSPVEDLVEGRDEESDEGVAVAGPRAGGPFDADEVPVADGDLRLDLGSLIVPGLEDYELQLPVDEASGQVVAVVYAGPESALEVRVFASPRNGDLWPDVRREIAAEVTRQGGTATEAEGPFGAELKVVVGMTTPEGQNVQQASRILGVTGPRWLLRATLFGQAVEAGPDAELLGVLRDLVVVRGGHPAPPGDALPLRLPPDATIHQEG